jgi:hypothetical protein
VIVDGRYNRKAVVRRWGAAALVDDGLVAQDRRHKSHLTPHTSHLTRQQICDLPRRH